MKVLIKGAGNIASGIALRLFHCGFDIIMTELKKPTSTRQGVCFSQAVINGHATVEDVTAEYTDNVSEAFEIISDKKIAVIADPELKCLKSVKPAVLIDAVHSGKNSGTGIKDASIVICVGPGFTAGTDCHAVIETARGDTLGRVIYNGSAKPKSADETSQRIIRALSDGEFTPALRIGQTIHAGQTVGYVGKLPVRSSLGGTLRGLLAAGTEVYSGMKVGETTSMRTRKQYFKVSDRALSVAGGVLEAIMSITHGRIKSNITY